VYDGSLITEEWLVRRLGLEKWLPGTGASCEDTD